MLLQEVKLGRKHSWTEATVHLLFYLLFMRWESPSYTTVCLHMVHFSEEFPIQVLKSAMLSIPCTCLAHWEFRIKSTWPSVQVELIWEIHSRRQIMQD